MSLKGTHFDPEIADAFLFLEAEFNRIREEKLEDEIESIEQHTRAVQM